MKQKWIDITIWILSGFIFLFCFLMLEYGDTISLLGTSRVFSLTLQGQLLHFYDGVQYAGYGLNANILTRWPLILWYIPGFGIAKVFHLDFVSSLFGLYWHKLFLVICLIICIKRICDINRIYGNERYNKYAVYILLLSPLAILSCLYSGQDEIVYITTFICGMYAYFQKKEYKFLFLSGLISCNLCPLMLLPFLFLVIIRDKNVIVIIGKVCAILIPQFLYSIIFSSCISYRYSSREDTLEWLFGRNVIALGDRAVSISALIIMALFGFYFLNMKMEESEQTLWFPFIALAILELGGKDQFYRAFIWIPFAVLLICNFVEDRFGAFTLLVAIDILSTIQVFSERNLFLSYGGFNDLGKMIFGTRPIKWNVAFPLGDTLSILLETAIISLFILLIVVYKKRIKSVIRDVYFCFVLMGEGIVFMLLTTYGYYLAVR